MEKKDIIQSLKDSLFTGLIALALFGPIVGLRTSSKGEGLFITPQWGVVFLLVGLCILGRFLINLNSTGTNLESLLNITGESLNGTTGEAPTTKSSEKLEIIKVVKSVVGEKICVLSGAGDLSECS